MNRIDFLNTEHIKKLLEVRRNKLTNINDNEPIQKDIISNYIKEVYLWLSFFGQDQIIFDIINLTNFILMHYPIEVDDKESLDKEMLGFLQTIDFYPHYKTSFKPEYSLDLFENLNLLVRKSRSFKDVYYNDKQLELYQAIMKGESLIINAPTSYGKSLITLNAVIDRIIGEDAKNILYIVPTKALINEYKHNIRKRCSSAGISNYFVYESPYVEPDFAKINFFVFTQERVLVFISTLKHNLIDIVVIDEAQNITTVSTERTILLLKSIEGFKKTQMVFLAPYVENFKKNVVSKLISNLKITEFTIKSEETLVSNNKYIVDLYNNPNGIEVTDITFKEFHGKQKYEILVNNPRVFESLHGKNKSSGKNDFLSVLDIFNQIATFDSKNIFFISSIRNSMLFPELFQDRFLFEISNPYIEKSNRQRALIKHLKDNIHDRFGLINLIENNISYHNSYLDSYTRRQIEKLYLDHEIRFLFTTSTIAQGVNLSATNMFIFIKRIFSGYKEIELSNIFGRASRIDKNTLGNLFFVRSTKTAGVYEKIFNTSDKNVDIEIQTKNLDEIKENYEFKTYLSDTSVINHFKSEYIKNNFITEDEDTIFIGDTNISKKRYKGHDYFVGAENVDTINSAITELTKEQANKFIEFYSDYESTLEFIEWLSIVYNWKTRYKNSKNESRILHSKFIATVITKLIQGRTIKQIVNDDISAFEQSRSLKYIGMEDFSISYYKTAENEIFDINNQHHLDTIIVNTLFQVQNVIEFHVKKYIQDFYYRVNQIYQNRYKDESLTNFIDFTTINTNKIKLIKSGIVDTFAVNEIINNSLFSDFLSEDEIDLMSLLELIEVHYGTSDPLFYAVYDALY